ncbi:hypothetical protein Tco_0311156 [Tanacetum coccineum]
MLYIAGLPRDLGVVNPFKKPVALLCSTKSCLSATLEDGELYRFAREDDSLDLECKNAFKRSISDLLQYITSVKAVSKASFVSHKLHVIDN